MECNEILKFLNILYVEDEQGIRETLKDVFEEDFNSFEVAKDGKEGLEKFKKNSFDIVITDIEMPFMNGMELTREIKEISPSTPVILLTAYSEKKRLFEAIDIGVNKYLVKPFTPEKLLDTICELAKKFKSFKIKLGEDLYYDREKRALLTKDNSFIKLTKKENLFLELLINNKNRVVSIKEIKDVVWKDGGFSETALRALVKRVRQKSSKELIKNFPSLGYGIFY